jgi:hypothetical protein
MSTKAISPETDIREKRYFLIKSLWNLMISQGYFKDDRLKLSIPLVDEVIEHYIADWAIIKIRYKIPNEIQLHKIAGLMAASILRYRPIIPLTDDLDGKHEIYANEFFAILHGLAICGEFSLEKCQMLATEDWFETWLDDFLHLLHRRNYTAEALAFIFETLCIFAFQENFEKSSKKKK